VGLRDAPWCLFRPPLRRLLSFSFFSTPVLSSFPPPRLPAVGLKPSLVSLPL